VIWISSASSSFGDPFHWRQQPWVVLITWLFPVMIVLMFGLLFGGAIAVPDDTPYFEFLMPGMFALTMLFGLETTMMAVTTDAAKGVTDRFRSLPINALAVVLGRCIADMLNSFVGLAIMVVTGLLLGWRSYGSMGAILAAFGLLLLLPVLTCLLQKAFQSLLENHRVATLILDKPNADTLVQIRKAQKVLPCLLIRQKCRLNIRCDLQ
jgi:hypothetical protein